MLAASVSSTASIARIRYSICASITKIALVWPMPVLGPVTTKKLGKPGDGRAEVGAGNIVPHVRQCDAVPPADVVRDDAVRGVVAGGEDNDVEVEVLAARGDDAGRVEVVDAVVRSWSVVLGAPRAG